MNKFHYTYEIVNCINGMRYIGVRTSTCHPDDDASYMGSSKYLSEDILKYGIESFDKEIIQIHETRESAVKHEISLHEKYDVGVNDLFYNRAKQTSTKFDTSGCNWELSDETKRRQSDWQRGKPKDYPVWNKGKRGHFKHKTETRELMIKQRTGRTWYNDGEKEILLNAGDTPPTNFKRGRLKRKR